MKIINTQPVVNPEGWYTATEAMKLLGMGRTSFYAKVREGKIKRRMRKIDYKFWYKGKDLLSFWNSFL